MQNSTNSYPITGVKEKRENGRLRYRNVSGAGGGKENYGSQEFAANEYVNGTLS